MRDLIDIKAMVLNEFITREYGNSHHVLEDETEYGRLLQAGNPKAIELMTGALTSANEGILSRDMLTNIKYFYVSAVTITTRYCIGGGMDEREAYYSSDLFIQQLDDCTKKEDVLNLQKKMVTYYVEQMANIRRTANCSKKIHDCINYIDEHLHEQLNVKILADLVHLSPDYFSKLFKKEIGINLNTYIQNKKLDAARKMLIYSTFNCSEIAFFLNYCSQSHFTKQFRTKYGITPMKYREYSYLFPYKQPDDSE